LLNINVLRATSEHTAQTRVSCCVCGSAFELGVVYAWLDLDRYGPDELCERCLRHLCEWARSEGLDVPWKDAHAVYEDARRRYTEPITTSEALDAMSLEEENRIMESAHLT
jgi:hypothetical protein